MNAFPSERAHGNMTIVVVLILIVIAVAAGGGYYLRPRLESVPPEIAVSPNVDVLGVAPLEIRVADNGTGLRSVTAILSQGGTEHSLASEQFDNPVTEKTALAATPWWMSSVERPQRQVGQPRMLAGQAPRGLTVPRKVHRVQRFVHRLAAPFASLTQIIDCGDLCAAARPSPHLAIGDVHPLRSRVN